MTSILREKDDEGALRDKNFPLSSKYNPVWIFENQMGPNALVLTEWVCRDMKLKPGMRVLDMGCGKALSSIFLAKEFDIEVWACDLWIDPSENWKRIQEAGFDKKIAPLCADAKSLPFAEEFFDAIISIDSYHYYGTNDFFLEYILKYLKPLGQIGIAIPSLVKELPEEPPEHIAKSFSEEERQLIIPLDRWKTMWEESGLVKLEKAEEFKDGWSFWLEFRKAQLEAGYPMHATDEIETLEIDKGEYLGFAKIVGAKQE
jgi:cyclopropane fatty-acyl-phospholipid synthase-like methyltransferase